MIDMIGNCYIENGEAVGFCNEFVEELIIPEGVVSIKEAAFKRYYGLKNVVFPNSLTTIGDNAFGYCSNLRRVILPRSVESIRKGDYSFGAFNECKQLIDADLSKTRISTLNQRTFHNCKKLQRVKLPMTLIKIENYAFWDCINLTSLELNEGLRVIECDFNDNKRLSILNIPRSVIHIEDLSRNEHIKTIVLSQDQYENFKEYLPPKCKLMIKE